MQTGQASVGAVSRRRCGKPRRIVDAMKTRRGCQRVKCGRENLWRARRKFVVSDPNGKAIDQPQMNADKRGSDQQLNHEGHKGKLKTMSLNPESLILNPAFSTAKACPELAEGDADETGER